MGRIKKQLSRGVDLGAETGLGSSGEGSERLRPWPGLGQGFQSRGLLPVGFADRQRVREALGWDRARSRG